MKYSPTETTRTAGETIRLAVVGTGLHNDPNIWQCNYDYDNNIGHSQQN